jgi:hypothetical protein
LPWVDGLWVAHSAVQRQNTAPALRTGCRAALHRGPRCRGFGAMHTGCGDGLRWHLRLAQLRRCARGLWRGAAPAPPGWAATELNIGAVKTVCTGTSCSGRFGARHTAFGDTPLLGAATGAPLPYGRGLRLFGGGVHIGLCPGCSARLVCGFGVTLGLRIFV